MKVLTSWSFIETMEAAGLVQNRDKIHKVVITATFDGPVMMDVTYFADERLLSLAEAAKERQQADHDWSLPHEHTAEGIRCHSACPVLQQGEKELPEEEGPDPA